MNPEPPTWSARPLSWLLDWLRGDFEAVSRQHPELRMLLTEVVAARLGHSAHDSLSGKAVQGYEIRRCVGRGGMGIVYEAQRSSR